jgi:hypothetical protein
MSPTDAAAAGAAEPDALPELQDQILDPATLGRLFTDLETSTRILEVVYKGAAEVADAQPGSRDLAAARLALDERRVLGVQIRYVFAGRQWWDTLLPVAGGVRLIRIGH